MPFNVKSLGAHVSGRFIDIMLVKEAARDAVRITLHNERAIFQIGQDILRDLVVILDEVAFRVAFIRPVNFIEICERDRLTTDFDSDIPAQFLRLESAAGRNGFLNLTFAALDFSDTSFRFRPALSRSLPFSLSFPLQIFHKQIEFPTGLRILILALDEQPLIISASKPH